MNTLRYAKKKCTIVKKILELDTKYTSDYLMSWTKKQLLNYYNSLVIKLNKKKAKEGKKDGKNN